MNLPEILNVNLDPTGEIAPPLGKGGKWTAIIWLGKGRGDCFTREADTEEQAKAHLQEALEMFALLEGDTK